MPRPSPHTPELLAHMRELRNAGIRPAQIALQVGLTSRTVVNATRDLSIRTPRINYRARILELLKVWGTLSTVEIQAHLQLGKSATNMHLDGLVLDNLIERKTVCEGRRVNLYRLSKAELEATHD